MQVITIQKNSDKKSTNNDAAASSFAQTGRAEKGMPALLIFSDADSIVKMGWLQRMEQLFPQHRSIVLHGSHHFPQEYDPASVVTAIRSWLDETIAR